jgi:hypothetical protein
VEVKATDSEEDCQIQKQLHFFFSLVLQADETALIPPYLTLDRSSNGFKDFPHKYPVANIKGFMNVKHDISLIYFLGKKGSSFIVA